MSAQITRELRSTRQKNKLVISTVIRYLDRQLNCEQTSIAVVEHTLVVSRMLDSTSMWRTLITRFKQATPLIVSAIQKAIHLWKSLSREGKPASKINGERSMTARLVCVTDWKKNGSAVDKL